MTHIPEKLLIARRQLDLFQYEMAERLGVAERVRIISGRNDVPRLMQAADVLVHPAYRENTGLVLIEAMMCGLPVLASDVCGYASHVAESGAGELALSPFDQTVFTHQVAEMLTSPRRDEWRALGRAHAAAVVAANDGSAEACLLEQFAQRKHEAGK
jgi:UDP-glucose:(heptosyl)LPS alpha-1,3-glucosyltransferase